MLVAGRRDVVADTLRAPSRARLAIPNRPIERNAGRDSRPVWRDVSMISSVVASRSVHPVVNVLPSTRLERCGSLPGLTLICTRGERLRCTDQRQLDLGIGQKQQVLAGVGDVDGSRSRPGSLSRAAADLGQLRAGRRGSIRDGPQPVVAARQLERRRPTCRAMYVPVPLAQAQPRPSFPRGGFPQRSAPGPHACYGVEVRRGPAGLRLGGTRSSSRPATNQCLPQAGGQMAGRPEPGVTGSSPRGEGRPAGFSPITVRYVRCGQRSDEPSSQRARRSSGPPRG